MYKTLLMKVASVVRGSLFAQLLSFAASPLLTRLYEVEEMGIFGLFYSFVSISAVFGVLRYDMAIVAIQNQKDAIVLVSNCLVLSFFSSVMSLLLLEIMRSNSLFGFGNFSSPYFFLAFVAINAIVINNLLRLWSVRSGLYSSVGASGVYQSSFGIIAKIALYCTGQFGLIVGEIVGRLAAIYYLKKNFCFIDFSISLNVFKRYKVFPLVQLPSSLLDILSQSCIVPLFIEMYSLQIGGAIVLAQRVVWMPTCIVGDAIADVFYAESSRFVRSSPEKLILLFWQTLFVLIFLGCCSALFLWFMAPVVAPLLFGQSWAVAGEIMSIMAPWVGMALIVSPLSRVILLSRRSYIKIAYDLCVLVIMLVLFVLQINDPMVAIKILSISNAIAYMLYLVLIVHVVYDKKNLIEGNNEA